MVQVESDWIELNSDVDLWVDALDFEETFNMVQHIPSQELDYPDVQNINKVVNLYKGDLLDGRYEDWCLYERERFKLMLLILLDKLLAYCESHGEYETGLLYGTRILRYDKARERAHRALMRLYYRLGHRIEALRQYDRCSTILQQELAVEPSKRTKQLYEQIKTEQFTTLLALDRMTRRTKPQVIASLLNQVIEHFDEAHQALVDIQSLMQENGETSNNGRTRNA
jgi:DNA-binding SARP family transcriptional activator